MWAEREFARFVVFVPLGQQLVHELGCYFYDHVRQVPIACNVELDFQLADFIAPLGLDAGQIYLYDY